MRGPLRGRRRQDHFPNAFDIPQNVIVPKVRDPIVMIGKPPVANGIAFIHGMLAAIDLDHQPLLTTDEIDNVGSNRFLTHKFEAVEST